jgi:hypothetical protein
MKQVNRDQNLIQRCVSMRILWRRTTFSLELNIKRVIYRFDVLSDENIKMMTSSQLLWRNTELPQSPTAALLVLLAGAQNQILPQHRPPWLEGGGRGFPQSFEAIPFSSHDSFLPYAFVIFNCSY